MCGLTGFFDITAADNLEQMRENLIRMRDTIRHRGPDDCGEWLDPTAGIGMGSRRLSIVDLSPTGHQPMLSADERYVIAYNGEIYNFLILRQELISLGVSFRGTSDTEVILTAICRWGIEDAIKKLNGMFAFALWDRREQCLWLCRDRLGIKPLYYGWLGRTLAFGSELKTLAAHPNFHAPVDRNALALYLRHSYIPAPYSIYQGIQKLQPGTLMHIDRAGQMETKVYWSARQAVENGVNQPFLGDENEAAADLDELLRDSVRLRMIADVPLGAFLSGGVDSSTIVALMQAQSSQPVRTFTIGFHEAGYDEAAHARLVAKHLGTDHTELYVTPAEAQAVVPRLPTLYDEPFADSSQIPTFLVSALARRYVTVSLSGDGGDELFAGYNRYTYGQRVWNAVGWLPPWGRNLVGGAFGIFRPGTWDILLDKGGKLIPAGVRHPQFSDKMQKLSEIIPVETPEAMYMNMVSHWKEPAKVVLGAQEPPTVLTDPGRMAHLPDMTRRMMYLDLVSYLPDDILVKVDRASMGISLESRVPFLDDFRVVEWAWRLPMKMKIRKGKGKWLLRQVLYRYVPQEMIERPKAGFAVPIDAWLRGALRDWAESLLDERTLLADGYFNPQPIRQKWTEHLAGKHNWQAYLWDVLMFQAWLRAA